MGGRMALAAERAMRLVVGVGVIGLERTLGLAITMLIATWIDNPKSEPNISTGYEEATTSIAATGIAICSYQFLTWAPTRYAIIAFALSFRKSFRLMIRVVGSLCSMWSKLNLNNCHTSKMVSLRR